MTLTSQMFNLKAVEAKKKFTVSDHLFANSSALTVCSPHNAANTAGGGVDEAEDREQQQKKQKYKHWMLRLTGQTVAGKQ